MATKKQEPAVKGVKLGSAEAAMYDTTDGRLRLQDGSNWFVLHHPDTFPVMEHYILQSGGAKKSHACGFHTLEDQSDYNRRKKWGSEDVCETCALNRELWDLYKEAKEADDPIMERYKEIARDLGCAASVLMLVSPCDVSVIRAVGGKKQSEPIIDDKALKKPQVLWLTDAAFEMFKEQWNESGLVTADAQGLIVNFEKGKDKKTDRYSRVLEVEFHKKRVPAAKLPKLPTDIDFSKFVHVPQHDLKNVSKLVANFRELLPGLLGGKKAKAGAKKKGK